MKNTQFLHGLVALFAWLSIIPHLWCEAAPPGAEADRSNGLLPREVLAPGISELWNLARR